MDTRRALLRGAALLALGVAIVGSTALPPSVSAASLDSTTSLHSVAAKTKDGKGSKESDSEGGSGLSNVPILGDVVNEVKNESPDELIDDAAGLAHLAVPLIQSFIK
jgi:hypothetical protein